MTAVVYHSSSPLQNRHSAVGADSCRRRRAHRARGAVHGAVRSSKYAESLYARSARPLAARNLLPPLTLSART